MRMSVRQQFVDLETVDDHGAYFRRFVGRVSLVRFSSEVAAETPNEVFADYLTNSTSGSLKDLS